MLQQLQVVKLNCKPLFPGINVLLLISKNLLPVCLLQLLVVELNRKPLFPGIYAPVMVSNNSKLIREILEAKKAG